MAVLGFYFHGHIFLLNSLIRTNKELSGGRNLICIGGVCVWGEGRGRGRGEIYILYKVNSSLSVFGLCTLVLGMCTVYFVLVPYIEHDNTLFVREKERNFSQMLST